MPAYAIDYAPSAAKELAKLDTKTRKRVITVIESLAKTPVPPGVDYMHQKEFRGAYRVRAGDYRIIYEVHHGRMLVFVIKIGDRREVYR